MSVFILIYDAKVKQNTCFIKQNVIYVCICGIILT